MAKIVVVMSADGGQLLGTLPASPVSVSGGGATIEVRPYPNGNKRGANVTFREVDVEDDLMRKAPDDMHKAVLERIKGRP